MRERERERERWCIPKWRKSGPCDKRSISKRNLKRDDVFCNFQESAKCFWKQMRNIYFFARLRIFSDSESKATAAAVAVVVAAVAVAALAVLAVDVDVAAAASFIPKS